MGYRTELVAPSTALLLLALSAACTGNAGAPTATGDAGPQDGTGGEGAGERGAGGRGTDASSSSGNAGAGASDAGAGGAGASDAGAGAGGAGAGAGAGGGGGSTGEQVCARWNADRSDVKEGAWNGDVSSCVGGEVPAAGRVNAVKLLNLYRFIAGLPPVTTEPLRDEKAQACALMMHANGMLSHSPPRSWTCYTELGAEGAATSVISPTPGVESIDLYMADPGNETTIGHRRWLLSEELGPIGLGSTSDYSCIVVLGGSGSGDKPFIAWPAPGPFPSGALHASYAPLDETGWTIQSSRIDLRDAQVTVTDAGENLPVQVTQLDPNFGSAFALRFNPQGWSAQAGHTYAIHVTGVSEPIDYEVEIIPCE
ncbi:CAP domain-containing protein [Sorangium sp. So ce362]|uniref:CAP domain-containing protein n=1 Tax=Sorangium sp. So ce362 TaxID=3133303 RepID=UPI003F638B39